MCENDLDLEGFASLESHEKLRILAVWCNPCGSLAALLKSTYNRFGDKDYDQDQFDELVARSKELSTLMAPSMISPELVKDRPALLKTANELVSEIYHLMVAIGIKENTSSIKRIDNLAQLSGLIDWQPIEDT